MLDLALDYIKDVQKQVKVYAHIQKPFFFYRVIWVIFLLPEGTIIAHTWLNFILQKLLLIANDIAGYNAGRLIMSSKVIEFIFKPKPIGWIRKLFSCHYYS